MADGYNASIDGIPLDIETIRDGFEKAVAEYEMPYRDGALTDDLGQKARKITFRCYFFNEMYERHQELLAHLESRELFELVHPDYGLIKGRIRTVDVSHDDRERTAEIDIDFIEHLHTAIEYAPRTEVKNETAEIYARAVPNRIYIASRDPSLLEQAETFIEKLEAELTEIANPANSLISSIEFGLSTPGRVIGAISRTCERYSLLYDSLKTMPEKFLDNLRNAMSDMASRLGFGQHIRSAAAFQAGVDLGAIYSADEDRRDLARILENTASFDSLGRYVKPEPTPELLDVDQIERSLATVQVMIQEAIDDDRSLTELKDLARALTKHAIEVKIEAEKLVTVSIDSETPLHLVCLQRGLPYNYAERICKVNRIPNPNAVKGDLRVYVR